jgi:PAS domain S-box-containing protein
MGFRKVEQKIIACFAAILLLIGIQGWLSVHRLAAMNDNFNIAADSTVRKIWLAGDIKMAVSDMIAADRGVLLYTREKNATQVEASKKLFADRVVLIERDIAELKPLISSAEGKHAVEVVVRGNAAWQEIFREMERLCAAGDVEAASYLEADKAMPLYHELDDVADKFQDMQLDSLKTEKEKAANKYRQSRNTSLGLLTLAFVVSVLVFIVVRRISAAQLKAKQAVEADAIHWQFKLSLLRAINEVSLDGILVVDSNGDVVSNNKQFLNVWQLPAATVPDYLSDIVMPVPDHQVLSANTECVKNPEAFLKRVQELYKDPDSTDHCEIELKDGRTLERYSTSLRNEETDYLGRVWFFRDISTRKQSERALQSSEEKFRQLAENIREVFWIMPPTADQLLYISPAYEQVWGRSRDSLYRNPMSWADAIHPEDQEQARLLAARQLAGESVEMEYRIRTPDGQEKWIHNRGYPVRDGAGQLVRIVGIAEEITKQKRYEAEQATTNRALNQAQKMEAVGRLAGGIAHDFNNILMVIQSYTEMLQEDFPAHDTLQKKTQEIMKATKRAISLTGQMLAFSRKQIISPVILDLNVVVNETATMLKRLIGEDIEFLVDSAESLWPIEADPDQIGQLLMNLCVNSRDAMPQGGTLTIGTGNVTVGEEETIDGAPDVMPGEYVELSVTDTGTGISKKEQTNVFEPFYTTKEVGKGTGLGLSMVYGIVKQSGGFVWVDGEPRQGARFLIYLPRAKGAIVSDKSAKASTHPRGTETLLIAEDEESLREMICGYLRSLGYTVFAAGSGHQALLLASEYAEHIDLLISDVVMPKMSGRELSEMLGSLHSDLKTIYMSGYTDDAVLRHGIREKAANFLQKPFSLEVLARKVRDTLENSTAM